MVEILQIKVANKWRSLEVVYASLGGSLGCRWNVVIKQFEVFCSFSSYTQHQAHYQSDHQKTSDSVHTALLLSHNMFSHTKLAKQ